MCLVWSIVFSFSFLFLSSFPYESMEQWTFHGGQCDCRVHVIRLVNLKHQLTRGRGWHW